MPKAWSMPCTMCSLAPTYVYMRLHAISSSTAKNGWVSTGNGQHIELIENRFWGLLDNYLIESLNQPSSLYKSHRVDVLSKIQKHKNSLLAAVPRWQEELGFSRTPQLVWHYLIWNVIAVDRKTLPKYRSTWLDEAPARRGGRETAGGWQMSCNCAQHCLR